MKARPFKQRQSLFPAREEAKRATEAGFELIVAAGGDGTINEVVNGIAPAKKRPKMAIIPAGTTNDYARALRISSDDPVEAARVILKGQTVGDGHRSGKPSLFYEHRSRWFVKRIDLFGTIRSQVYFWVFCLCH